MKTDGSGDELWDEFVREFEKNNARHEPAAAERAQQQQQQTPPQGRRSRGRVLVPLAVTLLVVAGAGAYALTSDRLAPAAAPAPSAPAAAAASSPATAPPSAAGSPSASAEASPSASAPSARAGSVLSGEPTGAAPLSVFPAQVEGYTLVAKSTNPVCTGAETVPPTVAGLIAQGEGCLGVDLALYKDADGNQYNLVLFTMKDQHDAMDLGMKLGAAAGTGDYRIPGQLPPADSGLRRLPADSGLVQSIAGVGHEMMVCMGQWSDGHSGDFNTLVQKLTPLSTALTHNLPEWSPAAAAAQDNVTT
ncbi:hypothetical protein [Kitasatospora sp. NPDC004272]